MFLPSESCTWLAPTIRPLFSCALERGLSRHPNATHLTNRPPSPAHNGTYAPCTGGGQPLSRISPMGIRVLPRDRQPPRATMGLGGCRCRVSLLLCCAQASATRPLDVLLAAAQALRAYGGRRGIESVSRWPGLVGKLSLLRCLCVVLWLGTAVVSGRPDMRCPRGEE